MPNLDLSLSLYSELPFITSTPELAALKQQDTLFGDVALLASLNPEIDLGELAQKDKQRRAGEYLRSKLQGISLTPFQARVLATLIEEDHDYREKLKHQEPEAIVPKGIDYHNGAWRVRKQINGKRLEKQFATLDQAKAYLPKTSGEAQKAPVGELLVG